VVFGWLGIHVPPEWTLVLSFLLFGLLITIGQATKYNPTVKNDPTVHKYDQPSFQFKSRRTLYCVIATSLCLVPAFLDHILLPAGPTNTMGLIVRLSPWVVPSIVIVLFARHRLYACLSIFVMAIFFVIMVVNQAIIFLTSPLTGYLPLVLLWLQ
jgi:hypothetical protein